MYCIQFFLVLFLVNNLATVVGDSTSTRKRLTFGRDANNEEV